MSGEPGMRGDRAMAEDFEEVFGYWQCGYVGASDVVRWADTAIEAASSVAEVPEWLTFVSLNGPEALWKRGHYGDPRPRHFDLVTSFRLLVEATDDRDDGALERFMRRVSRLVMGEDLALPEVQIGYEIDGLMEYDYAAAATRARSVLHEYRGSCTLMAKKLPWRAAERA